MVRPILMYGCEIWGYGNNNVLEKVKFFLNIYSMLKVVTQIV